MLPNSTIVQIVSGLVRGVDFTGRMSTKGHMGFRVRFAPVI